AALGRPDHALDARRASRLARQASGIGGGRAVPGFSARPRRHHRRRVTRNMSNALLSLLLRHERDVVLARQRARQIAVLIGFQGQDQTRLATAVSEIARNAVTYAAGGKVEFSIEGQTVPQVFAIRVSDQGPGIAELPRILAGEYRSPTGMGLGIIGTRRLMDHVAITSTPASGTSVVLKKIVPRHVGLLGPQAIDRIAAEL